MRIDFDWKPAKAASNAAKHGVTFQEAMTVFVDPFARTIPDPDHSAVWARQTSSGVGSTDRDRQCRRVRTRSGPESRELGFLNSADLASEQRKARYCWHVLRCRRFEGDHLVRGKSNADTSAGRPERHRFGVRARAQARVPRQLPAPRHRDRRGRLDRRAPRRRPMRDGDAVLGDAQLLRPHEQVDGRAGCGAWRAPRPAPAFAPRRARRRPSRHQCGRGGRAAR